MIECVKWGAELRFWFLFPGDVIPNSTHTIKFFLRHGATFDCLKVFPHLDKITRSHHTYIDRWIGEYKSIAINGSCRRFAIRRFVLIQKMLPASGCKRDNPRSVAARQKWERLAFCTQMSRVVANVKDVKNSFFVKPGKNFAVVAGKAQKSHKFFFRKTAFFCPLSVVSQGQVHFMPLQTTVLEL